MDLVLKMWLYISSLNPCSAVCIWLHTKKEENLCIFIKYSSEWMGEARLCRWLLGDGGNLWKFKWIEREFVVCCVNHKSRSGILRPQMLQISWNLVPQLKRWPKIFNEVLLFNKRCASTKWADQVIYCCEMAFVMASFIHFTLTKDWFKIWSWLNYSWILYYALGSLCSVSLFIFSSFISMCWHPCDDHKFPVTSTYTPYALQFSVPLHVFHLCRLIVCITCKNEHIH